MKIGELAKRSGLAPSRIRFYETIGLLSGVQRNANGYRDYTPDVLMLLTIITGAQKTGFSLQEIKQMLPASPSNWQHEEVIRAIDQKIVAIESMQTQLAHNKLQLRTLLDFIAAKPEGMNCSDNSKRVFAQLQSTALNADDTITS